MTSTFLQFYEENLSFVWRSLRRLGVPESDCADAAQEVFIVVHRRLPDFEARSKVTTWLFGICLRVASSARRAPSAQREVSTAEAIEVVDEGADIESELERKRGLALLQTILERMPLEQRTVFVLFELEGVALADITEVMGVPLGTVQSRLRLARASFRGAVEQAQAKDRGHNFRLTETTR